MAYSCQRTCGCFSLWTVVRLLLCLLIGTVSAQARPPHKRALADYFGPFLTKNLNDCRTCHVPEKPGKAADALAEEKPHNPFGARLAAVRKELRKAGKKASIPQCLEVIANEDSDGDGVPNLVELLTGHNPGDPLDKPTAAELAESGKLLAAFRKHLQAYRWTPMETAKRPPVPKVKNPSWVRNPI